MIETAPGHRRQTVVLEDRLIPYTLRESGRARSVGFTMRADTGLVVTVPKNCPPQWIERSFQRWARWVLRNYERMQAQARRIPQRWPYGNTLPYLGTELPVRLEQNSKLAVRFCRNEGWHITSPNPTVAGAKKVLDAWFRREASIVLKQRTDAWAQRMAITYNRLTVRAQRTRWGSCSEKRNISLNYALIMAPEPVMDYVVIHELYHCVDLSHSRRYWAGVAQYSPEYKKWRRWLNAYGPYLGVPR